MKYFRQRDHYSCGAVALLNAFKWMGIATSSKHLPALKMMLGTKPFVGTSCRSFGRVARDAGFTRIYKPTIKKLDAELIAGNALIVFSRGRTRRLGHFYLIVRRTEHYFVCVNLFTGKTVARVSKKLLARVAFSKPRVYRVRPLEVGPNLIFLPAKAA